MFNFGYRESESRDKLLLGLFFLPHAGTKQSNYDIENSQAKNQNSSNPCYNCIVISTSKVVEDSRSHAE